MAARRFELAAGLARSCVRAACPGASAPAPDEATWSDRIDGS